MRIVFRLFGWVVGLAFFLMGLALLTVSTEIGLCLSGIGLLYLPPIRDAVYEISMEELEASTRIGYSVVLFAGVIYFSFREQDKAEAVALESGKPVEQVTVDPWLPPEWISLGLIVGAIGFSVWGAYQRREMEEGIQWERERVSDLFEELESLLAQDYTIMSCSRCHEGQFIFLEASTGAKTVQVQCQSCGKKTWARNRSDSLDESCEMLLAVISELDSYGCSGAEIAEVNVNQAQQRARPKREHISQSVRQEVYERDGGVCVECGTDEQLEYDHILPFSKGGSSRTNNLQLLCKTCNLRKGASI